MAGKFRGKEGSEAVLTFRLPRSLHDKLKEAAGDRSVSEEMRERLEASLEEPEDLETREWLGAVAAAARSLPAIGWHPWHKDPDSYRALIIVLFGLSFAFLPEGKSTKSIDEIALASATITGLAAKDLPPDLKKKIMRGLERGIALRNEILEEETKP